ncbi:MAG: transposase [Thermoguttaceae bacterium]|nr:transposase [Thermoguttaceae bacterium]
MKKISAFTGKWRTPRSFESFLSKSEWDERDALCRKAFTTLRQLGWTVGQPLCLAIDETQIQKCGSCMEGVSKRFRFYG